MTRGLDSVPLTQKIIPSPASGTAQVITAALAHFTRGMPPLTMSAAAKVPADFWGKGGKVHYRWHGKDVEFTFPKSSDGEVYVHKGELITGVIDKAIYGKFGLVHGVQVSCSSNPAWHLIPHLTSYFDC